VSSSRRHKASCAREIRLSHPRSFVLAHLSVNSRVIPAPPLPPSLFSSSRPSPYVGRSTTERHSNWFLMVSRRIIVAPKRHVTLVNKHNRHVTHNAQQANKAASFSFLIPPPAAKYFANFSFRNINKQCGRRVRPTRCAPTRL